MSAKDSEAVYKEYSEALADKNWDLADKILATNPDLFLPKKEVKMLGGYMVEDGD